MNEKRIINISLASIMRECNKTTEPNQFHHENMCNSTYHMIHDIFHYRKFQEDFGDYFTLYSGKDSVLGKFRPSYEEFVEKVSYLLNMKISNPIDDKEFEEKGRERLKVLEGIKTEEELQKEFPALYRDLIEGRKYMNITRAQKGIVSEEEYQKRTHYYYSCALQYSFKNFLPKQVELYRRFIEHRKEYQEKTKTRCANRYLEEHFDQDKLAMLVIAQILNSGENTDNREEIETYLSIIGKYINSNYNLSGSIMDDDGNRVDIEEILRRYRLLQMKLKETSRIVNWELIPETQQLFSTVQATKKARKTKMSQAQINHLRELGEERTRVYEQSNYLAKVMGKLKYKGYVAYIYPNGEVILDREYNRESISSASGNALFNMKAIDFEALSKLDKFTLTKDPKAKRIIHSKGWKEKVQEIISREGSEEEQIQAKELVKKLGQK